MNPKQSEFATFAVDLVKAHANEILAEKPLQLFWILRGPDAGERAAALEEFYTEGRNQRHGRGADPKGES